MACQVCLSTLKAGDLYCSSCGAVVPERPSRPQVAEARGRIAGERKYLTVLCADLQRSTDLISDALLVALIETGVPVWALEAELVDVAGLGIRTSSEGESFGTGGHPLPAGRLVVADSSRVHSLLFGTIAPGHEVTSRTRRVTLFSVAVDGVPSIHVEEALWTAVAVLTPG